uniref:Uncharacterized protein n=1 Tax=Hordeum vulgare subsp. vulgare TaxID=112509 RepID=A0A8I7BJ17_HORVV
MRAAEEAYTDEETPSPEGPPVLRFVEPPDAQQEQRPGEESPRGRGHISILPRPAGQPDPGAPPISNRAQSSRPGRFASPPLTLQRRRPCVATGQTWTLGAFLSAATKQLDAMLPSPEKHQRPPLNFSPRRGRSAAVIAPTPAACTTDRRAVVQILRTLGIVGAHQQITPVEMKAYDDMFATPIKLPALHAIAALVDRAIPAGLSMPAGDAMACAR